MTWFVEIRGRSDVLEFLSSVESSEWQVTPIGERYELKSTDFDGKEEAGELYAVVKEFITAMSGVCALKFGSSGSVKLGDISRLEPNGTTAKFLFPGPATVEVGLGAPSVTPDFVAAAVALSRRDAHVSKALRLWVNEGRTWSNLYNVFEIIQASASGLIRSWVTESEISRFKHSANHPDSAGDRARHGHSPQEPPKRPMQLREARLLIERLMYRWIEARALQET